MKLNYLGVPVYMNGQNYYIPSLAFRDFKANYEILTATPPEGAGPELLKFFEDRIPLIGSAIRRNYPEVTDDELLTWLDPTTLPMAIQAVISMSGVEPVSEGE